MYLKLSRKIKWLLFLFPFIVFSFNGIFFIIQDSIIFQATSLNKYYVYSFKETFEEFNITTSDKENLNALLFKTKSSEVKGIIIYFHGNRDNLARWGKYAKDFTFHGYDILMVDYRGYGKSTGSPSEFDLYLDAEIIWEWVNKNFKYKEKIIYGRSLGGAIASYLAAKVQPSLLILETPFDELNGALSYYNGLMFIPLNYQFSNVKKIPKIKSKIFIFAGSNDWVVPISSTLKLKPLLKQNDAFIIIDKAGHNNLRDFPVYHEGLRKILNDEF